jgi:hypothetical protein
MEFLTWEGKKENKRSDERRKERSRKREIGSSSIK